MQQQPKRLLLTLPKKKTTWRKHPAASCAASCAATVCLELLIKNNFLLLLQLPKFRIEIYEISTDFHNTILQISEFLRIFRDYLWFPAIPTKFRENLDEKSPILDDFSNILQKSQKNYRQILQIFEKKSANFEFGAVQRYVYLVDLEKCF